MKNPFIAGNWVRGADFVGREALISEVLSGRQRSLWICGTRRLGKTSLLKQIEYLCGQEPYSQRFTALFWDMQGGGDEQGLRESLLESIEDAEEILSDIGVEAAALESLKITEILRRLRKQAGQAGRTLLLLCDECEELLTIEKNAPELLPKLRRVLQRGEHLITVLTASKRLMMLEQSGLPDTSPFLHGFTPPLYLGNLEKPAALQLIRRGGFSQADARQIMEVAGNHPYLLQLLCRRYFEQPDLEGVIEQMCNDELVGRFFAVDFDYLREPEKRLIREVLQSGAVNEAELAGKTAFRSVNLRQMIYSLLQLGYLREQAGTLEIANYFFRRWLQREQDRLFTGLTRDSHREAAMTPEPGESGKQIGDYRILEEIGRGGMGTVYKARDERLGRIVAVKTLEAARLSQGDFLERFYREARTISRLNHPNITIIYDIREQQGRPYLVMELVDGQTLLDWLNERQPGFSGKLAVARQIAAGLAYAHREGIIHRDIKPENIMVKADGTVKLMDFGLAKTLSAPRQQLTAQGTTLGTFAYMAPEQLAGASADIRSDIYSLGVVFFQLFSGGALPYPDANQAGYMYAVMHTPPASLRRFSPEAPAALDDLLMNMLAKQPQARCRDLAEVIRVLEEM